MKRLIVALSILLAGCSTGHYEVDSAAMNHSKMVFIGIPLIAGSQGTTTPITAGLSLTNKHVAAPLMKTVVAQHRSCDLAVIEQDNADEVTSVNFNPAKKGDNIQIFGYSARSTMPVSSAGKVLGFRIINGCLVGVTDAGSVQGMSGGPVINSRGEIVGIFFGFSSEKNVSYFVPYQEFKSILPRGV